MFRKKNKIYNNNKKKRNLKKKMFMLHLVNLKTIFFLLNREFLWITKLYNHFIENRVCF